MKKIKSLFFLPNLYGGGAERITMTMIRKLDKERFEITLVLGSKSGDYIDLIPKQVNVIDLNVKKTLFSPLKLRKIVQTLQPDILFSTLFRTHQVVYLALLGIKKRPIIVLRSPNSPKLLLENHQLGILAKFLLEKAYNDADLLLAQTAEMKEEIFYYHHISREKIQVFINPVDTDLIDKKIQHTKNPFHPHKINVVAAGRLTQQKGFDLLIEAFQRVVENNDDFVLHIIGRDDGQKQKLTEMIHTLHLTDNVKLLGFQENPYRYFFFSNLYVLSSRWEGLPNTVLENMYLNKPVVATRCIPFMDTLIQNGINGMLVESESPDKLADAIINYQKIKKPGLRVNDTDKVNTLFLDIRSRF